MIGLGLIIAAVPQNTTHPYKLTASQLLEEVKGRQQFFSPDELAGKLIDKDPSIQLIDVRDPHRQAFNEVGLVQYAHDAVGMEPTAWVRYLLQQALAAHGGDLPAGAILVSLMCRQEVRPPEIARRRPQRVSSSGG